MAPVLAPSDPAMPAAATVACFGHEEFDVASLAEAKRAAGASVHVVIPARNEEATVGEIVRVIRCELVDGPGLVDDLVVVDDASSDETAAEAEANGATVMSGPGLGKGEAMACALGALGAAASASDALVVFLDADVVGFGPRFVSGLVGPLLADERVQLVKASYSRPIGDSPTGGGRVTELVAKPALGLLFPALATIAQPLAGESALRGSLLERLELAGGYAVEVAMLIDTFSLYGPQGLAQVDLGERRHRNRSLDDLVPQAREVMATVLGRAGAIR